MWFWVLLKTSTSVNLPWFQVSILASCPLQLVETNVKQEVWEASPWQHGQHIPRRLSALRPQPGHRHQRGVVSGGLAPGSRIAACALTYLGSASMAALQDRADQDQGSPQGLKMGLECSPPPSPALADEDRTCFQGLLWLEKEGDRQRDREREH